MMDDYGRPVAVPNEPPDPRPGFFQSLGEGGLAALQEGRRMTAGDTFTDAPPAPEVDRTWLGRMGFGLGHSAPTLAAGGLGAAAGTAAGGPVGGVLGSVLGFGGMSALQEIIPAYDQARRLNMDHAAAVDYAIRRAAASGAINAAIAPVFAWAPFKTELSNILLHTFATGPTTNVAQTVLTPRAPGQPEPSLGDLGQAAVEGAVTGGVITGGHAAGRYFTRPPEIPTVTVTGHREAPPSPEPEQLTLPAPGQGEGEPGQQTGSQEQLPVPQPRLPSPDESVVPGTETKTDATEELPGSVKPTELVPSPDASPPRIQPDDGSSLPVGGQGQTGVAVAGVGQQAQTGQGQTGGPQELQPGGQDTQQGQQGQQGQATSVASVGGDGDKQKTPTPTETQVADVGVSPKSEVGAGTTPAPTPVPFDTQSLPRLNGASGNSADFTQFSQVARQEDQPVYVSNQGGFWRRTDTPPAAPLDYAVFHPDRPPEYVRQQDLAPATTSVATDTATAKAQPETTLAQTQTQTQTGQGSLLTGSTDVKNAAAVRQIDAEIASLQRAGEVSKLSPSQQQRLELLKNIHNQIAPEKLTTGNGEASTNVVTGTAVAKVQPEAKVGTGTSALDVAHQPGTPLENGFFSGPEPGQKFRVSQVGATSGVLLEKRSDLGSVSGFYVGQDGKIIDAGTVDLSKPASVDRIWKPETPERAQEATAILREMGTFNPLEKAPRLIELREQLRRLVTGEGEPTDEEKQPTPDTTTAADKTRQSELDQKNQQLERQNTRITELEAKGAKITPKEAQELASRKQQQERLIGARDALVTGDRTLEQRTSNRFARRGAKLSRKPVSPFNPKPFYAPRDAADYHFRDGETSVHRTAFADAGYNPDLAVNFPLARQIDILTRQTKKQFGLKDVTVDPSYDKFQLRGVLLDVYRAATDMMASLSYPTNALGLEGTVALHLQPYDRKVGYTGQYHATAGDERTIKLVGSANSLGHEWTHALDHFLVAELPNTPIGALKLATEMAEQGDMTVPRPGDTVAQRLVRVIHTLSYDETQLALKQAVLGQHAQMVDAQGNPTPKAIQARAQLDQLGRGELNKAIQESPFRAASRQFGQGTKDPDYYPSIAEMLARSHEAYLSRKMLDNAVDPRGVVMPDEAYTTTNDAMLRAIYPRDQQRVGIFNAWDDLHTAIRSELFTGNPAGIFSDPNKVVDFNAITRLEKQAPAGAIRALRLAGRETVEALKHPIESWRSVEFLDKDRPAGPRPLKQRMILKGHEAFSSKTGLLESIHAFAPTPAKPAVMRILQKVGLQPGSGKQQPITFEERSRTLHRDWTRQFLTVLDNNGITPQVLKVKENNLMLRHALVTGDATYHNKIIPANITKAAGQIREVQNRVFKSNRDAGMDIQYAANGHFTRRYDHQRIWNDPDGFTRDATKLFKSMFDDDVNGDPEKLYQRWLKLSPNARSKAGQGIQDAMKQLRTNLSAQRAAVRNLNDPHWKGDVDKLQDRLDELKQAAQDIHDNFADGVGNHVAGITAQNWVNRINNGYPDDFDAVGPSGNYLNHRKLPPEADTILEKWMHNDVVDVMLNYYKSAARKQAYNELFGPIAYDQDTGKIDPDMLGPVLEADIAEATRNGLHGQDARMIRDIVQAVTGKASHSAPRTIRQASQVVQAFAATTMLGHATLSMAPEPLVASLVTGRAAAGPKALYAQLRQVLRTADGNDRAALADFTNVTQGALFNDAQLRASNNDYSDTPQVGRFMSYYYDKVAWMTPWDASSRRASQAGLHWALQKSANDYITWKNWQGDKRGYSWARADSKGERAEHLFNELGVDPDPEFRKHLTEWLVSGDGLPDLRALETSPFRDTYDLMMNRLVRRTIQDVARADIPMLAENEWVGLALQFSRYLFAFNRNVLLPMFSKVHHDTVRAYERARGQGSSKFGAGAQATGAAAMSVGNAMITTGIYLAGVAVAALMSMALFSPDVLEEQWQKDDFWTDYFFSTVLARSGLTGPLGIPQQALNQMKYRDGLSSMTTGPGLGNFFNWVTAIMQGLLDSDPTNTNTRGYNALAASHKLLALPLEAYILTKLAGGFGPWGQGAAWIANMFGSSRAASDWFASTIAGPKGTEKSGGGAGGEEALTEGGVEGTSEDTLTEGGAESMSGGPKSGGGSALGQTIGLLDDFISPISKFGAAAWNTVPAPLKPLVISAAIIWGGWQVMDNFADTRNAPPKEPP